MAKKLDNKFKKQNKRKFAVKYYNKELYDFDYLKLLSKKERIYLQNFFNEEYCNQRLPGSSSVYYSPEALELLKNDPKEYPLFLKELAEYKEEMKLDNPKFRISQLDFFVIYKQRESGRNFYKKQLDVLVNRRVNTDEAVISFDEYVEMYFDDGSHEEDDREFFMECYKNSEIYRYITIKLIEIIDEAQPANFKEIILNIKTIYLMHHDAIRKSEKASVTKSSLYKYLYQIFAYYKVTMPEHEEVKKVVAVFDNCVYNKTKKVMNELLKE